MRTTLRLRLGLEPDFSASTLDELLYRGEADARALDFVAGDEGVKDTKDALVIARIDSGAVVAHGEFPGLARVFAGDDDARIGAPACFSALPIRFMKTC